MSDRVNVMTCKHTGVTTGMAAFQTTLVHMHCIIYCVVLATKDATSEIVLVADYQLYLQQILIIIDLLEIDPTD